MDIERSLAFYTELLGFHVAGRSLNRGSGQDRLDGLAGCEVDVVALEPAAVAVPHVELLHYRRPPGRSLSAGFGANDVPSVRQVHAVDDLDALVGRLGERRRPLRLVRHHDPADGTRAASVRDPDGHMLVLTE